MCWGTYTSYLNCISLITYKYSFLNIEKSIFWVSSSLEYSLGVGVCIWWYRYSPCPVLGLDHVSTDWSLQQFGQYAIYHPEIIYLILHLCRWSMSCLFTTRKRSTTELQYVLFFFLPRYCYWEQPMTTSLCFV